MYRDAELRMPCCACGADLPLTELEVVPGGYRCAPCTYGRRRDPLEVVCNGCHARVRTGEASIVTFGTGYLCAGCSEKAGALLAQRRSHDDEERRLRARRLRTQVAIAAAGIITFATIVAGLLSGL